MTGFNRASTRAVSSLVRTGTCGHSESAGPLVRDLDAGIAKQIHGVSPGTVPGPRSSLHIAQFSRSSEVEAREGTVRRSRVVVRQLEQKLGRAERVLLKLEIKSG